MKVLVTGAAGYIGRQAVPLLTAGGAQVHVCGRRLEALREAAPQAAGYHPVDLLEPASCADLVRTVRPSHVLHLAWYAVAGSYSTSPLNVEWVSSTLTMLKTFAEVGGRRFVAAGTCAEYDWSHGFLSEDVTPLAPTTLYGACKRATGDLVAATAGELGLSHAWGRVFFSYGPNEYPDRLVASVIRALLQGQVAECTAGLQYRDYLHVSEVGSAFASLLNGSVEGAVNIGSGQPTAVRDIVGTIARIIQRPELVRLGARPTLPTDPPLIVADVRKLRTEVGWSSELTLERGLRETVEWWKARLDRRS